MTPYPNSRIPRAIGFVFFSAFASLISVAELPEGDWVLARSPTAVILTDHPPKVAEDAIERFALLERLVLRELRDFQRTDNRSLRPHYLVLPKSKRLFQTLAPIQSKSDSSQAAGFYLHSEFNPLILAQARNEPNRWETIHHEYTHRILHARFDTLPLWADEGLAEVFSSLSVGNRAARLTRSKGRTRRYSAAAAAFFDWNAFFRTTRQELLQWIETDGLKAQAYYAQAALLAEFAHFGPTGMRERYWDLIARARFKPIAEMDCRIVLGYDYTGLDKAVRERIAKRFSASIPRGESADFPVTNIRPSPPSSTAALLAIAYTRGGKAVQARELLNRFPGAGNPQWLAARAETIRSLGNAKEALAIAQEMANAAVFDPFLITLATVASFRSGNYQSQEALASLNRARNLGDTSALMFSLAFQISRQSNIPFEQYSTLAKEGVALHPQVEYATELNRIEVERILDN